MYYLYEIIGKKVGVTQNLTRRQKEQKEKGSLILIDVYHDIYQVSEKELELQAEKGYHVDIHPYWYTVTVQNAKSCTPEAIKKQVSNNDFRKASIGSTRKFTEQQVIGIRKEYATNIEITALELAERYNVNVFTMTNLIDGRKYSEIPGAVELRRVFIRTCPHCNTTITGKSPMNFKRWHGDNCKQKSY